MNQELDEIEDILKNGLITDVFDAVRFYTVFNILTENSGKLNESEKNYRNFFSMTQRLTQNAAILSLSRVFDKPYSRKTRCIAYLLNRLKELSTKLPEIEEKNRTIRTLEQYNLPQKYKDAVRDSNTSKFPVEIAEYYEIKCLSNQSLKDFRDKFIAHNDIEGRITLKWEKFEELINLSKEIIEIIGVSYFGSNYAGAISRDAELNGLSIKIILNDLGVK